MMMRMRMMMMMMMILPWYARLYGSESWVPTKIAKENRLQAFHIEVGYSRDHAVGSVV